MSHPALTAIGDKCWHDCPLCAIEDQLFDLIAPVDWDAELFEAMQLGKGPFDSEESESLPPSLPPNGDSQPEISNG